MAKVVTAEYRATEGTLKLDRPLEGVADHARVTVDPWIRFARSLPAEAGDVLAAGVEELFGEDNETRR